MANGDGWWPLASGLFLTGFVLGVVLAPSIYRHFQRVKDAKERWLYWDREHQEIDEAVRGE